MFSDRSCGWLAALAGVLALAVTGVLSGCGGDDDQAGKPSSTATSATSATKQPRGTSDRGARGCTRAAFLAALLADVEPLAFKVDQVRCKGEFARTRFVGRGCPQGQATKVPCGSAKVAAWRRGAKRWRLVTYADNLTCAGVRSKAADFPQSLCG